LLVISKGALVEVIFLVSTFNEFSVSHVIFAPNFSNIVHESFTSLIFGTFSNVHSPSINKVAGIIATAAFFAPLIFTSPLSLVGPFITNFSKVKSPF